MIFFFLTCMNNVYSPVFVKIYIQYINFYTSMDLNTWRKLKLIYLGNSRVEVHHFVSKETTKLAEDFLVPRVIFQAHFRLDLKKKTICKYKFYNICIFNIQSRKLPVHKSLKHNVYVDVHVHDCINKLKGYLAKLYNNRSNFFLRFWRVKCLPRRSAITNKQKFTNDCRKTGF